MLGFEERGGSENSRGQPPWFPDAGGKHEPSPVSDEDKLVMLAAPAG
jgi:hypothetical protein